MANRQPQRQTLAAAVFAACLTMSIAAQAQEADADAQPAASEDQPTTLATMTVTAPKREEALQDVPLSVTVLDQTLLPDTDVSDLTDQTERTVWREGELPDSEIMGGHY